MDVKLSDKLEEFVQAKVASGEYKNSEEVFAAALSLLKECDQPDVSDLEELKREIGLGVEQLDRGESAPWDGDALKAEGRKLRSSRSRKVN
jgi:antitoxin ParD1/3/4